MKDEGCKVFDKTWPLMYTHSTAAHNVYEKVLKYRDEFIVSTGCRADSLINIFSN